MLVALVVTPAKWENIYGSLNCELFARESEIAELYHFKNLNKNIYHAGK